jgi:hypothetical protein
MSAKGVRHNHDQCPDSISEFDPLRYHCSANSGWVVEQTAVKPEDWP